MKVRMMIGLYVCECSELLHTRECVVFFSRASCRDIKKRAIKCRASCTARNYCSIEKKKKKKIIVFANETFSVKRKITNV